MLFRSPQLRNLIIAGRKTQTRQRVRAGKAGAPRRACAYRVGGTYGLERPMRLDEADELQRAVIEGRHKGRPPKKEIGRITITAVDRGPLGAITYDDARREGFDTTTAFKAHWVRQHDNRWIDRREVTTDPETGTVDVNRHLTDDDLAARFDERWALTEVWIISFRIVSTPVYLAARPNRIGGDYVTTEHDDYGRQVAMTSELVTASLAPEHAPPGVPTWSHGEILKVPEEAVHPALVDAWKSDPACTHQQIKDRIENTQRSGEHQRALDRRNLALEDRIVRARHAAKLSQINVKHEIHVFRQAQKHKKTPEHLELLARRVEDKANRREVPNAA